MVLCEPDCMYLHWGVGESREQDKIDQLRLGTNNTNSRHLVGSLYSKNEIILQVGHWLDQHSTICMRTV